LRIIAGIAVFLTALHFAHGIHHFVSGEGPHGLAGWAGILGAVAIDVMALVGGIELLRTRA
jgi:hypothetical protein